MSPNSLAFWITQPTAVFLPGESHGQRILVGYSSWGHKESDPTNTSLFIPFRIAQDLLFYTKRHLKVRERKRKEGRVGGREGRKKMKKKRRKRKVEKRGVGEEKKKKKSNFLLKRQTACFLLWPGGNFIPFTHTQVFVLGTGYFLGQIPRSKLLR